MSETSQYDITQYTVDEMLAILKLPNANDLTKIYETTNAYITKASSAGSKPMYDFFTRMQQALVQYNQFITRQSTISTSPGSGGGGSGGSGSSLWDATIPNLYQPNTLQKDKITDRTQEISVYDDLHLPMKRNQLGIPNSYQVPVAQDTLNPNLKNSYTRFIVMDSQYRQGGLGTSSTDYTADLSDVLYKVLSLRLYSIQIPHSWYAIDVAYLNNYFIIQLQVSGDPTLQLVKIEIPSGNYTPNQLTTAINTELLTANISNVVFKYNATNSKMEIQINAGITYIGTPVDFINIIFYEQNWSAGLGIPFSFNQTLGWSLGFRNIIYNNLVNPTSNPANYLYADAVVDLCGPRYLILSIDDFNQNHVNNGLVTITESSKYVKVPPYYQNSSVYSSTIYGNTLERSAEEVATTGDGNILNYADKIGQSFKRTQIVGIGSDGKQTLTQPQIYTINQILKNNSITTSHRNLAPTTQDVLAIIPVKPGDIGDLYVDFSGPLQDNRRTYFGPVDIDRLKIKIYNDKGQLLNLNGLDWSCTLSAEMLYQY